MPWLRVDDGFAEHYKIAELSDREFRVWMRTLCYAARHKSREGRLTPAMRREIQGLSAPILANFRRLGLLEPDENAGTLVIHHWSDYNPKDPSHAARQARYRGRKRDGESDVEGDALGDAPNAGTRARPVPSPTPEVTAAATEARPPAAEEEIQRLQRAGWSRSQVATVNSEADAVRAVAWLEHAEHDTSIRAAGAFAWTQYQTGNWPPEQRPETRPPDPSKRCDDCGATYGEGHEDDCPKVARARKAAVA